MLINDLFLFQIWRKHQYHHQHTMTQVHIVLNHCSYGISHTTNLLGTFLRLSVVLKWGVVIHQCFFLIHCFVLLMEWLQLVQSCTETLTIICRFPAICFGMWSILFLPCLTVIFYWLLITHLRMWYGGDLCWNLLTRYHWSPTSLHNQQDALGHWVMLLYTFQNERLANYIITIIWKICWKCEHCLVPLHSAILDFHSWMSWTLDSPWSCCIFLHCSDTLCQHTSLIILHWWQCW